MSFFRSTHSGMVRIDRKKDMILVSGFNVYPNEIEGVVAGASRRARVRRGRRAGQEVRRGREAVRREEGPGAHRRRLDQVLPRAPDRLQVSRATSSSATTCPSRTSARSCAANCATRRRRQRPPDGRFADPAERDHDRRCPTSSRCCGSCRCRPTSTSTATSSAAGSCRRSTSPAASSRPATPAAGWRRSRSTRSRSSEPVSGRRCRVVLRRDRARRHARRSPSTSRCTRSAIRRPGHGQGDRGEPHLRRGRHATAGRGRTAAAMHAAAPLRLLRSDSKMPGSGSLRREPAESRGAAQPTTDPDARRVTHAESEHRP